MGEGGWGGERRRGEAEERGWGRRGGGRGGGREAEGEGRRGGEAGWCEDGEGALGAVAYMKQQMQVGEVDGRSVVVMVVEWWGGG